GCAPRDAGALRARAGPEGLDAIRRRLALGTLALAMLGALLWLARGRAPPREPAPAPERTAAVRESIPSAPPAPATRVPAPSAAVDPAAARRAELRARLESDLAEHLPDRKLSSDQLDAATD